MCDAPEREDESQHESGQDKQGPFHRPMVRGAGNAAVTPCGLSFAPGSLPAAAILSVRLSRVLLSVASHCTKRIPMYNAFASMIQDEEGATLVEYALIVSLIAVVAIVGVKLVGTNIGTSFTNTAGSIK
jgi:pilus assembly protein Flp/PilA